MPKLRILCFLLAASASALCPSGAAAQGVLSLQCVDAPTPADTAKPEGLPEIGKWMIASDGSIASWLGWRYFGKGLLEPVNVIIFDKIAATAEEAYSRLIAASTGVEFDMRTGHSTGYDAIIGGQSFEQLPERKGMAISDGPFELANNHGRIFGPFPWNGGWLFTAAFSRETLDPVTKVKHHYASFNRARDAFAWALDRAAKPDERSAPAAVYRVLGFVPLGNALIGDAERGTGDHDGLAVYLAAVR
jgi:hypothetical protein